MLCVLQDVLVRIDHSEPDNPVKASKDDDGGDEVR